MLFPGQHSYCCPMQGSSQRQPGPSAPGGGQRQTCSNRRLSCPLPCPSLFDVSQTSLPNKPPALLTGPQHLRDRRGWETSLSTYLLRPLPGTFSSSCASLSPIHPPVPTPMSLPLQSFQEILIFIAPSSVLLQSLVYASIPEKGRKEAVFVGLTAGRELY